MRSTKPRYSGNSIPGRRNNVKSLSLSDAQNRIWHLSWIQLSKEQYGIHSRLLALVLEEPKIQTIRNRNQKGAVIPVASYVMLDGIPHRRWLRRLTQVDVSCLGSNHEKRNQLIANRIWPEMNSDRTSRRDGIQVPEGFQNNFIVVVDRNWFAWSRYFPHSLLSFSQDSKTEFTRISGDLKMIPRGLTTAWISVPKWNPTADVLFENHMQGFNDYWGYFICDLYIPDDAIQVSLTIISDFTAVWEWHPKSTESIRSVLHKPVLTRSRISLFSSPTSCIETSNFKYLPHPLQNQCNTSHLRNITNQ